MTKTFVKSKKTEITYSKSGVNIDEGNSLFLKFQTLLKPPRLMGQLLK